MSSSADPVPVVPSSVLENTHVIMLTMETPFGLMRAMSAPMRASEASMTADDFQREYVETRQPWPSRILDVTVQRK
jgi:hypothetical protein